ncbi:uncharacterized protein LOC122319716 [Drosophila ficusphila]|uniref:uncharacterized protein LOC122319716 n=1 Tax=Drosophila ficusphila TaxID=30025 RepID=UPI001C899B14|nr:uncharacterized protein LOC122319716 [Drosophila ficusphila]
MEMADGDGESRETLDAAGAGAGAGVEGSRPPGSHAAVTVIHWTVVDICGARSWG